MNFGIIIFLITIFSLIGAVLNVKKKVAGFYIWVFTNSAWVIVDCYKGIYWQGALFSVYAILAIYGIREWRKDKKGDK